MLQLEVEIANRELRKLSLCISELFVKAVALAARAHKKYVFASLEPKFVPRDLLLFLSLYLFLGRLLLISLRRLLSLGSFRIIVMMLLLHEANNAILAVEVEARLHLVYDIGASNSLASVKDVLHAAVALPFLETLLECLEVAVNISLRLFKLVFEDLRCDGHPVYSVAHLEQ
jgi:hypothetical protein